MGPLSYMRSVVDRNVIIRRIPVIGRRNTAKWFGLYMWSNTFTNRCSGKIFKNFYGQRYLKWRILEAGIREACDSANQKPEMDFDAHRQKNPLP